MANENERQTYGAAAEWLRPSCDLLQGWMLSVAVRLKSKVAISRFGGFGGIDASASGTTGGARI